MTKEKDILGEFSRIQACRLCKSKELFTILDFGNIPLANSYPTEKNLNEVLFPLSVAKCDTCGHVQLRETVSPGLLFGHYSYSSSDSPALLTHFKQYAATVTTKLSLGEYDSVLEIGSNDGILLREFSKLGIIPLYGVEPASNMVEKSTGTNAILYNTFFTEHLAKNILIAHGKMSLVCANNVFAHVADIDSMIKGITQLLTDDGIFVFENAYLLDTIKGLYFDQVYHEHLQYFGIKPLVTYLAKFGLEIFDIERVATQGGSFRIYAKRVASTKREVQPSVQQFIKEEDDYNLYDFKTFSDFNNKLIALTKTIKATVQLAKAEGKSISCYGCPAKFALLSKVFGFDTSSIEYVVDDSPLKQGRQSPGKRIPIVSGEHFKTKPTDYSIISAWNMADSIIARNKWYTGKWIIPMPSVRVI